MGTRDSILQQSVPVLGQQGRREFEIISFTDGTIPVYVARAFVGGKDAGMVCDAAQAPVQSASADLIRIFLALNGWAKRVSLAPAIVKPGD